MSEYTEVPVSPCHPGCERCAKALRVLGPVSYNNWRSFPEEVHEQSHVALPVDEDERTP